MRSGLFNYSEDDDFFAALTSDPQRSFTPRQLLDYAFRHPVLFQPGQKFSYCNTNLILPRPGRREGERSAARDYLKQHILDPAGMKDTLLPKGSAFPHPARTGLHRPDGERRGRRDRRLEPVLGLGGRSDGLHPGGSAHLGAHGRDR